MTYYGDYYYPEGDVIEREIARTRKFSEIFPSVDEWNEASVGGELIKNLIPSPFKSTTRNTMLYYLLYAKYGESHIVNRNEDQWKLEMFSRIYQYGGIWEKKLYVRDNLLAMTDEELREGGHDIINHATNPNTDPNTEIIARIDGQSVNKHRRSKVEGYAILMSMLDEDITRDFLKKFENMFLKFLGRDEPLGFEYTVNTEV